MYSCTIISYRGHQSFVVGTFMLNYVPRKGDYLELQSNRFEVTKIAHEVELQQFAIYTEMVQTNETK